MKIRKRQKRKLLMIVALVMILILVLFGILYYVNNSKNNYSFSERNWINDNTNSAIGVSVEGNLPLFSSNGKGVFYDYLSGLEKDTGLSFDITVNNSNADYQFVNKNNVSSSDLVFYTDHYVLIGKDSTFISDLGNLGSSTVGVIKSDKDYVSGYLNEYGLEYKEYDSFSDLVSDVNGSLKYAIVPMFKYLKDIMSNDLNVLYHIEGLHSHYVLSSKDSNSELSVIYEKFFNKWGSKFYESLNDSYLSLYYETSGLSELDIDSITGVDILVGYVDNLPYEGKVNKRFSGLTDEYLTQFGEMTGVTYKYIKYKSVEELNEAIKNKKVDIVLNYYNLSNSNYVKSSSLGNIEYAVISHKDNVTAVNNLKSIRDDEVYMINNTSLYSYVKNNNINATVFSNFEELFKNINEKSIIVSEKSVYDYYKNSSLKDYVIRYIGYTNNSNSFLLNNENKILNNMFNFYLSTLGSETINNMAISNTLTDASNSLLIQFILNNITYILALIFAVSFFLFKFNKKVKVTKKIKKEDKMMYLDVMTNLKNRNYLNDNLSYWESNKIYPQAVVVVDLNDIAVINDTKGHEEGDRQIKSAANILIKTQRENTEIVRTDGNEFLVYMVGYEEKQVVTYVNKLMKELKGLPYEYGAGVGYSLITSESTTIDDAINEALIMMRKNKGE